MSFALPEPWLSRLHPRRGGAGVRPVEPDPRAREVVDGQLRELPDLVPGVIAGEFTEPELRAAATAWCAGDPAAPPAGAAVAALATKTLDWQEHVRRPWFADLWLGERGLRFAAEAAVELFSLILVAEGDRPPRRAIRRDGTEIMGVRRRRPGDESRTVALFFDPDLVVLLRVRAALAAAPDDVHAEVVEAITGYRERGPHTRCATSVLVPSRAERVAADLTGVPAARIRRCLSGVDTVVPAPPEALPPLLADPPWRRRRVDPLVVLDLKAPETPITLEWLPGERAEWLSSPLDRQETGAQTPTERPGDSAAATGSAGSAGISDSGGSALSNGMAGSAAISDPDGLAAATSREESAGGEDWAVTAGRLERGEAVDWREAAEFFVDAPEETARPLLAEWRPVPAPDGEPWMRRIVARFEANALLPLRRLAFHDSAAPAR